jgi:uncharacterized protein (UPF0248 family)
MAFPREILNEMKWRSDRDLLKAEIWYVHRGAPNDTMIISGSDIMDLERSFMVITNTRVPARIPFHRIFKIVYDGKVIFEREKK